ncbi:MAG: deoxynucleoside kinase [Clostridia bacterium]|nr:deoxynucleoside kinase [Clostridia bacterium]
MGKLIVLEGLDGSGKSTQYEMLKKVFGDRAAYASFPDYDTPSGGTVKQYLSGEFGGSADSVNAYAASAFYAVNRVASFLKDDWGRVYREGGLVFTARYTTSNAVHQASKLPQGEWEDYFAWLEDTEYRLYGLPKPDLVIYLRTDAATSKAKVISRGEGVDIHEADSDYMSRCARAAEAAAKYGDWQILDVLENGRMLPPDVIHRAIVERIASVCESGEDE